MERARAVNRMSALVLLLAWVILPAGAALGQATSGNIIGTVKDASGAIVPGAEVKATDVATGISRVGQTDPSGNYTITQLAPGTYTVTFSKAGFEASVQNNVTVAVGTSTPVNATLNVGSVSQTVTVSSAPPLVETDKAEVTTLLTSHVLENVPVLARNFTNFELLLPGTVLNNFQHPLNENPGDDIMVNTNGQDYDANNFMINGTTNNDAVLGISILNPPLDSVEEAKVTTANYDAQFSQAGGSVIQVQTKSGSNQIHGSAFEFLQNNIFEARDPFTPGSNPELRFNQFGGSLGGPIKKDKAFWFVDYQGNRENLGGSVLTRVPTAAERSGNLSDLGVNIYDPTTGDANGNGRTLFGGATIPPGDIVPQATKLLSFLPQPNILGASGPGPNYSTTGVNNYDTDQVDVRVDDYLTSKLSYFGTYSYEGVYVRSPGAFGLYGGPEISPPGINIYEGISNDLLENGVLGVNYVFSPSLLTDFRFGATRYRVLETPLDANVALANQVGIPGINLPQLAGSGGLPDLNINGNGGFQMGYQCNCPLHQTENLFQWISDWTKIKGNHTVKWGGEVQAAQNLRLPSDNHRAGVYFFNAGVTASAADPTAGTGLASFLLGDPSTFQRFGQVSTNQQDRQKRMFYYGQDTWRVTSKLTLSYGLRWDTWFPDESLHPGQGGHYEIASNLVQIPGIGGVSMSGNVQTDWTNFSPRFAIAYALKPTTVVRTGWARSYYAGTFGWNFNDLDADIYPSIVNQQLNAPNSFFPVEFATGAPLGAPSIGTAPPLPVFPVIPSSGLIPLPNGISDKYNPANQKFPYVDSFNLTVEHAFGSSMTASIGYVGNVGRDLNMGWNLNEPIPGPGSFSSRQPYFALFGITQTIFDACDCESSNYNSLQAQLVKRFTRNLSFTINYTWQKAMDYGEFGTPTDQYDTMLDYGPASFNRSNVLTVGHTYILPFGKGQRWASGVSGVVDEVISGWQWSGFTTIEAGMPLNATVSNTANLNSNMGERPDQIGNPFSGTPHNATQWFNPAAFAVPATPFVFGDESRDNLTGPPLFAANWALAKNFKVTERANLQFRWEVYNLFNYPNLGTPNTTIDAGQPGLITSIASPMRNMQFGLHLTW